MKNKLSRRLIIIFVLFLSLAGCIKKDVKPIALQSPVPTDGAPLYMQWDSPPEMTIDAHKIYLVTLKMEKGDIKIQLFADKAPVNVNNFIFLINQGFYNNLTFHRVDPDFIAQAGKPPGANLTGPGYFVEDEINPEFSIDGPGWVAMAKKKFANTNGSQFFITYIQAPWLDGETTIIGKVVEGMDIVKSITPKDDRTNVDLPGDKILEMTVSEIQKSLLPPPQPTPVPSPPEMTEGRPLAKIPYYEKGFMYQKPPDMIIDVNKSYSALFKTTKGDISFELYPQLAPGHVNNFYVLVNLGYYDNFPVTNVLRSRYAITGTPDKTPRTDVGYALPPEINMKQEKGALCAWLHAKRDEEHSSSGSMIAMIMTNAPNGINAFTFFGLTTENGLEIIKTLTPGDIINKVEIIVK